MTLVVLFDVIALLGFGTAAVSFAISGRGLGRRGLASVLMLIAMLLLVFVSASNVLEHAGVTKSLDSYEDYVEVLFFPLLGYAAYVMASGEQIARLRMTQRAAVAEHDLLMHIVDTSPVGIVVVDGRGCAQFANTYAWEGLLLKEIEGPD